MRPTLVAAAAAALLLVPASASAAPTWLAPVTHLQNRADARAVDAAVGPSGQGIVLWSDDIDNDANTSGLEIMAAVRPAGGAFGEPTRISLLPSPSDAAQPRGGVVAFNDDGRALIAWRQDEQVMYRVVGADGAVGPAKEVTPPGSPSPGPLDLAVRAGNVSLTWSTGNQSWAALGTLGDGLAPAAQITGGSGGSDPVTALDDAGNAVFAWRRIGVQRNVVEARVKPAGQPLGAITPLTPDVSNEINAPSDVGIDDDGRVVLLYIAQTGIANPRAVRAFARTAPGGDFTAGTWGASKLVSAAGEPTQSVGRVEVAGDGSAVAVYQVNGTNAVRPSYGGVDGNFTPGAPLLTNGSGVVNVDLASDGDGNVVATWANTTNVMAAIRGPGEPFGAAKTDLDVNSAPSGSQEFPAAGIDPEGNALIAAAPSICSGPCKGTVKSFTYDAAPPRFTAVSIPGAAATGAPVAFGASAIDQASNGVSIAWDFGDGATAAGEAPTHAYGAPGTYTVTVTAADAAGLTRSQSGTVTVSTPAPPQGPPRISATTSASFKAGSRFTTVKKLAVKSIPAGATVYVKCTGGKKLGCPFTKTKKLKFKKATKVKNLTSLFNVKNRKTKKTKVAKLRPKAKIEVGTYAPSVLGNYVSFAMQKKKQPKKTTGCLAAGSSKKTGCGP